MAFTGLDEFTITLSSSPAGTDVLITPAEKQIDEQGEAPRSDG